MLNKIWRSPLSLGLIQPQLTQKMITEAENLLGFSLPKEYIDLLQIQNGGSIRFTLKDTLHNNIFGIGPYSLSITDFSNSDDEVLKILAQRNMYPFDAVGDGEYLCFEYNRRTKNPPKITYLSFNPHYKTKGFIFNYDFTVAKSFSAYLKKLKMDTIGIWIIKSKNDLEKIIEEVSDKSKIIFETLGQSKNFKYSENGNNLYVSSNKVSPNPIKNKSIRLKGYEDLMEKYFIQYPETHADYHILECINKPLANKVIKLMKKEGIEVESLKSIINKGKT